MHVCVGADADPAEWPSLSGDGYHRQGNGEEVWQVLQEDALSVFTKRSKVKVSKSSERNPSTLTLMLTVLTFISMSVFSYLMRSLWSFLVFRPTAAELLKHKFFTKAKVSILALSQIFNIPHVPFIYRFKIIIYLFQNNEYLQERLLFKGPTISERSKKVRSLLTFVAPGIACWNVLMRRNRGS